jgi:hypothetical protein
MSDKAEKKPDEKPAAAEGEKKAAGGGGGLLSKTPVLMGIVMLVEAVVLIGGIKFIGGGPKSADAAAGAVDGHNAAGGKGDGHGDGHGGGGGKDAKKVVELPVLEMRAPNKVSGRMLIIDVSIKVAVKADKEESVKATIAARQGLITDRVRTIIAQSDPEKLGGGAEPGLETLRRQVKHQLDEIFDKGTIEEVLVPRCTPFRADY